MPRSERFDRVMAWSPDDGGGAGGDAGAGGSGSGSGDGGAGGSGGGTDTLEELKSALRSERARSSQFERASKQQSGQLKTLQDELDALKQQSMSDTEKAIEKARKEASDEARSEVQRAYDRRIVAAEVKALAAGKLTDPGDAVRFLDLDQFKVTDGDVDAKAVGKAIDELIKDKPYLSAAARKPGGGDGGARGTASGNGDWLKDAIARRR